jgi:hypothetical protein
MLHVEGDDLLAADDHDPGRPPGERQGLGGAFALLAGIALVDNGDGLCLKEPLSFLAADSALAMVQPVDFRHERGPRKHTENQKTRFR